MPFREQLARRIHASMWSAQEWDSTNDWSGTQRTLAYRVADDMISRYKIVPKNYDRNKYKVDIECLV